MFETVDNALRRAEAMQRLKMERDLAPLALTLPQFAMLEALEHEPGLSGAALAERERLTPPTISVIATNLERKQLIRRNRGVASGRTQSLELTDLGRAKVGQAKVVVAATRRRLSEGLDPSLLDALLFWLQRVSVG